MVKNKEQNPKTRSTSGITMLALVITIIVLLILAAVSVATLTGENGILTRAQQAKIETEKAAIEEQIRLAILSAKTKAMGGNITIQDVLEELDKAGVDYETEEGEGGTSITVDGDYVFDLTEKDGDIDEPSFQGTVDKPKPKIGITETNYEENTIQVKVSTRRNEQGSLEFYIKEEGQGDYEKKETIENAPEEYTYTFEVADKTKTYRIKVVALAKNGETAQTEITVVGIPTLSSSNTTFTYTPTTATNQPVTATITIRNINTADYALQYSIANPDEESSWKDYTKAITLTQNGSVYARLKDKKKGQAGKYTKIGEIENIDRTGPVFEENQPTATATTNSITITGSATDEANEMGIYQYGLGVPTTDGQIKWTWEPENGTTETEHTFDKLTQGITYSIQMKATDSLGNETESEIKTIKTDDVPGLQEEITDETTGLKTGNTAFAYNPSTWTNGETVGITATIDEQQVDKTKYDTIQYKTEKTGESGEVKDWTTYPTRGISLTRNQKIYLRVIDSTGQYADIYATGNVDKIDRNPPEEFEITAEVTSGIELKDASDEIKQKYQFIKNMTANEETFYLYSNNVSAGDIFYCSEGKDGYNAVIKEGYYRAVQTTQDKVYIYSPFVDTNYFEYLGESYLLSAVTVKGSTTDKPTEEYPASGMATYQFGISKDGGQNWEWEPKTKDEEGREVIGKPAVGNQDCSYTFDELVIGTNYQFKMKSIDNAGNERDSKIKEFLITNATNIANSSDKSQYYGATVTNYTCTNSAGVNNWKIFYADTSHIYLIADDYIASNYAPNGKGGSAIYVNDTPYKLSMQNVINDYSTGSDEITDEDIKALNKEYFTQGCTSNQDNMRGVAYMLDTNIWSGFKGEKAKYAVGGPTIEMFINSYNQKYKTNYQLRIGGNDTEKNYGYEVSTDGGATYDSSLLDGIFDKNDSLYTLLDQSKASAFWIASPATRAWWASWYAYAGGGIVADGYNSPRVGFRPLVCLNSNVQLEKTADETFIIK